MNAALVKHKLAAIVSPEIVGSSDVINNKGNTEHLVTVKAVITLVDTESGESVVVTGIGSGQDGGDKAVMKAQTAAIKYAYMLSLAISTNDDPEADSKTDENVYLPNPSKGESAVDALFCSDCGAKVSIGVSSAKKELLLYKCTYF